MEVDESLLPYWKTSRMQNEALTASLASGGGGPHPPGMDPDIAILKHRADQSEARLERIENKIDHLSEMIGTLAAKTSEQFGAVATKTTVWTALGTGAGIAFAVVAMFIGILAYLQDQRIAARSDVPAATPQVVLQLPPWPSAPPPATPAN